MVHLKGGSSTNDPGDIDKFAITPYGTRIIYSSSRPDAAQRAALSAEALQGFRFDGRILPISASRPDINPVAPPTISSIDLTNHRPIALSSTDKSLLDGKTVPNSTTSPVSSGDGSLAWTASDSEKEPSYLNVLNRQHQAFHCRAPACRNAFSLWWSIDGKRIGYLRREGWAESQTSIYEWNLADPAPTRLYSTNDLLADCQPIRDALVCAREQSLAPRHLVSFDLTTRQMAVIFDPNPGFEHHALGRVERINWRNRFGIETFGDLIYPVGYTPGQSYPLIVTQYQSRGFLRGGTGDEMPIQPLAARGFAILSVQRPNSRRLAPRTSSDIEFQRAILAGFKDRRSVLSSIERGVVMLIRRGIVDPTRVGIAGLSDGSSTVQFASLNSHMFKAGSVSGCCWEPYQDALLGPETSAYFHKIGWPRLADHRAKFWSRISLTMNPRKVRFPILMQMADDEYRAAIASYIALRQGGKTTALFVFPNEHHVKWQPAHRLAVYERNIRWFDYWLRGLGTGTEWSGGAKLGEGARAVTK